MNLGYAWKKMISTITSPFFPEPERKPHAVHGLLRSIDLIICQDAAEFSEKARVIAALLTAQGCDIKVEGVYNKHRLMDLLKERHSAGLPPPTDIFMDVSGGHGASAAFEALQWIKNTYPGAPSPAINFASMDLDMAINAARQLREVDATSLASAVDLTEMTWVIEDLEKRKKYYDEPDTVALRNILNARFDCGFDLKQKAYYREKMTNLDKDFSNNDILSAWQRGKVTSEEAIERMRSYALNLAASLRSGVYAAGTGDTSGLQADATFYGAAGFPMKGKVVFSVEEVAAAAQAGEDRPVLVMGSFDPSVVPLLAAGKLGGLAVLSSYMASHLKLLCETHMVTGLFGVMPEKKESLSDHFKEESQPDSPPYLSGDSVVIAGQTVKRGQSVLLGAGGNGIVLNPPESLEMKAAVDVTQDKKLKSDLKSLRLMQKVFADFFEKKGVPVHGVKANIDAGSDEQLAMVNSIGLMRTEQMVATDAGMLQALKADLLEGSGTSFPKLMKAHWKKYTKVVDKLNEGHAVKIRLFDFVHSEILNKKEQEDFLKLYPRLDIHGGDALKTWPDLYRLQASAIFEALDKQCTDDARPLEVMMPAVRTKEDVAAIKKIVMRESGDNGIAPHRFRFGVMVETLEACKNIEEIAPLCDFISFGTNDLTQQYTSMARGDFKAHARFAEKNGYDPFKTLAPEIMEMLLDVTKRARAVNPGLKIDLCGAQGADPAVAMKLFAGGVDNVSVAANVGNLYGLPMVLDYQLYDAMKKPQPAAVRHLKQVRG